LDAFQLRTRYRRAVRGELRGTRGVVYNELDPRSYLLLTFFAKARRWSIGPAPCRWARVWLGRSYPAL